jgi:hypothetical protein
MIDYRPCGACVELVPADTGCGHWKPAHRAEAARKGKNRNRDNQRARTRAYRARQKAEVEAARERGRALVQDFTRVMTGEA